MKNGKGHNKQEAGHWIDLERMNEQFEIPFAKSKADVWAEMEAKIEATQEAKNINLASRPVFRLAMAASLIILLGLAGLMRFYSVTLETLPGQHLTVDLPDGSVVQLNAASSLGYYPYWWRFSRQLSFEGEAFFDVEKGSRFTVSSVKGITSVLGTSFNIYSRNENYRVSCLTGKVRVADLANSQEVILMPNEMTELTARGEFDVRRNVNLKTTTAWINNEFVFTSAPLNDVLEEIERQYDVTIAGKEAFQNNYTGNFTREQSIEQVLAFVCKPFSIKFEKINTNEFKLSKNN